MQNRPATKFLKLPFQFERKLLLNDLFTISSNHWIPQMYTMNYQGEWTSIALLSQGTPEDNFAYASANKKVKQTEYLEKCPYFKSVLDHFHCPLISARLLKLSAHSEIKPHSDFKTGYEDNNFRIHIPIVTNNQVEFILDNEKLEMLPGECWYTNVNFIHSVTNNGSTDRVHLVIDGERNDWSDKLFFSLAPKESFNLSPDQNSQEVMQRIIKELKMRNEPGMQELITNLENELKINKEK